MSVGVAHEGTTAHVDRRKLRCISFLKHSKAYGCV